MIQARHLFVGHKANESGTALQSEFAIYRKQESLQRGQVQTDRALTILHSMQITLHSRGIRRASLDRHSWLRYGLLWSRRILAMPLAIGAPLWVGGVMFLVGADDLLDEIMAHHVLFAELDYADSREAPANFQGPNQTGCFPCGEVDLRDIAGNHCLGIKSQARQKHLHLLAG